MKLAQTFGLFEDDLPGQRRDSERVMQVLIASNEISPPTGLKQKILSRLGFAGDRLQLNNLPPTSRYSNRLSWLEALGPLLPTEPIESIFMQEIRRDERYVQSLVVSKVDVPEEVHEEYAESFFILEGCCACTIGGEVFELSAGDYLDIPLHIPHDVKLLTPEVKAIIQYQLS